jgi:hypothetical protein
MLEAGMSDEQRIVIVTGASSGIGEATAREFGMLGARLVLAARRLDRLQVLAAEIEALGRGAECLVVQADLSRLEDIQHMVELTLQKWGRIDVLVNNAGFGRLDWLEKLDPVKDIQAQMDVNVMGVIQTTRQVLPVMIRQRSGSIINMCSMAGLIGTPTYTIYAASKHAVHGFSEALRREVRPWGIRVCLLYPGGVLTEFAQHAGIQRKTKVTTPPSLLLTAAQVGKAVVKLSRHPRRMWIFPWPWGMAALLNKLWPGLVDYITIRNFTIPERATELSAPP